MCGKDVERLVLTVLLLISTQLEFAVSSPAQHNACWEPGAHLWVRLDTTDNTR